LAVQYNSLDMVNALLDGGADINRVNDTGNTALHVAVNHGFIAISRLLQIRGADVDVVNAQGQTARTIAIKWNLVPILEFLDKYDFVTPSQ
jgi:ankyrin repeat protein